VGSGKVGDLGQEGELTGHTVVVRLKAHNGIWGRGGGRTNIRMLALSTGQVVRKGGGNRASAISPVSRFREIKERRETSKHRGGEGSGTGTKRGRPLSLALTRMTLLF